eukprot:GDKI01036164.1.p1 GENE.GDKI01036164.1~~GDKI01036164.1.p1  ORF type:complete len:217 (-),score=72.10 GDKI01036164.1:183-761(-)
MVKETPKVSKGFKPPTKEQLKAEKKAFMSSKTSVVVSGKLNEPPPPRWWKAKRTEEQKDNAKSFNSTVRNIRELVLPHLDGIQKKQMETAQLRAMGGKADKQQKQPVWMLKNRNKNMETKHEKLKNKEKELGVKLSTGKHLVQDAHRVKKEEFKKKREKEDTAKTFGFGGAGREKGGILYLKSNVFKKGGKK